MSTNLSKAQRSQVAAALKQFVAGEVVRNNIRANKSISPSEKQELLNQAARQWTVQLNSVVANRTVEEWLPDIRRFLTKAELRQATNMTRGMSSAVKAGLGAGGGAAVLLLAALGGGLALRRNNAQGAAKAAAASPPPPPPSQQKTNTLDSDGDVKAPAPVEAPALVEAKAAPTPTPDASTLPLPDNDEKCDQEAHKEENRKLLLLLETLKQEKKQAVQEKENCDSVSAAAQVKADTADAAMKVAVAEKEAMADTLATQQLTNTITENKDELLKKANEATEKVRVQLETCDKKAHDKAVELVAAALQRRKQIDRLKAATGCTNAEATLEQLAGAIAKDAQDLRKIIVVDAAKNPFSVAAEWLKVVKNSILAEQGNTLVEKLQSLTKRADESENKLRETQREALTPATPVIGENTQKITQLEREITQLGKERDTATKQLRTEEGVNRELRIEKKALDDEIKLLNQRIADDYKNYHDLFDEGKGIIGDKDSAVQAAREQLEAERKKHDESLKEKKDEWLAQWQAQWDAQVAGIREAASTQASAEASAQASAYVAKREAELQSLLAQRREEYEQMEILARTEQRKASTLQSQVNALQGELASNTQTTESARSGLEAANIELAKSLEEYKALADGQTAKLESLQTRFNETDATRQKLFEAINEIAHNESFALKFAQWKEKNPDTKEEVEAFVKTSLLIVQNYDDFKERVDRREKELLDCTTTIKTCDSGIKQLGAMNTELQNAVQQQQQQQEQMFQQYQQQLLGYQQQQQQQEQLLIQQHQQLLLTQQQQPQQQQQQLQLAFQKLQQQSQQQQQQQQQLQLTFQKQQQQNQQQQQQQQQLLQHQQQVLQLTEGIQELQQQQRQIENQRAEILALENQGQHTLALQNRSGSSNLKQLTLQYAKVQEEQKRLTEQRLLALQYQAPPLQITLTSN